MFPSIIVVWFTKYHFAFLVAMIFGVLLIVAWDLFIFTEYSRFLHYYSSCVLDYFSIICSFFDRPL